MTEAGAARWSARWRTWRNAVIGNPQFQQWAARTPLIRRIARRRAMAAFNLVAGFCYSQILSAAVELDLLDLLNDGPCDAARLHGASGLSTQASERLLRAAAALDLAEEIGPGRWMLGQTGAALRSNPGALAMVRHHRLLYQDLADPVALLRQDRTQPTALSRFWHYAADADCAEAAPYSRLMAASQAMIAREAIGAYPFHRHRRLLDVGGGHGAFAGTLARQFPSLEIGVFDLPAVLEGAREKLEASDLRGRIALHGGDFFADPLPPGHDCITLSRILHDHDDAPALALLRAARSAIVPGGRVVIIEPMAGQPGTRAVGDAYFGLYLWAMNAGRPRTSGEYRDLAARAGFRRARALAGTNPVTTSVVVCFT